MPSARAMDFFSHQDAARKRTGLLVFLFVIALGLIIAGVYVTILGAYLISVADEENPQTASPLWNPALFGIVAGCTLIVVMIGSIYKIRQLASGGETIAILLGGRRVFAGADNPDERRLLNVVEEMAIASGLSVPRVFILDRENGINAFAAGYEPFSAVICVTRGCMNLLNRDELQGVIAHEFSHILNSDMSLNTRLMGVLNGILIIGIIGRYLCDLTNDISDRYGILLIVTGLLLMALGSIGVFFGKLIKCAISRQREFLADASAVQFSRNPAGLAGALRKIGGLSQGSRVLNYHAMEVSHFFFANALSEGWFDNLLATHPPLAERIRRIDPSFNGIFPDTEKLLNPAETKSLTGMESPFLRTALGTVSGFATTPDAVISTIGTTNDMLAAHAAGMISVIPGKVLQAARQPLDSQAIIYALLLSSDMDIRTNQMSFLAEKAGQEEWVKLKALLPLIDELGENMRLPLIDLTLPVLSMLPQDQAKAFQDGIAALVEVDGRISLTERMIQSTVSHYLSRYGTGKKSTVVSYYTLPPVLTACITVLSALAHHGSEDHRAVKASFDKGAALLRANGTLPLMDKGLSDFSDIEEALTKLSHAAPDIKKLFLRACASCVIADNWITVDEAELLRTIAVSLHCPLPPFVPGKAD